MNDQQIEKQILAKGLTAPRVTKDEIEALMARVTYTGGRVDATTSTIVHAFLDGTFLLASGHSACVSPENFDADLGYQMAQSQAMSRARDQLWLLEGYALRSKLAAVPTDFRERVRLEAANVAGDLDKLRAFCLTPFFETLPTEEKQRLTEQEGAMAAYADVLERRIAAFPA